MNRNRIQYLVISTLTMLAISAISYERSSSISAHDLANQTLHELNMALKANKHHEPELYILHESTWFQFSNASQMLFDNLQRLKSIENNHLIETDKIRRLNGIVKFQSAIKQKKSEVMQIRGLSESLAFKLKVPIERNQDVIRSLEASKIQPQQLSLLYQLGDNLKAITQNTQQFWQASFDQQALIKDISFRLEENATLCSRLLDNKKGINAPAPRRAIVSIRDANRDISGYVENLTHASGIFSEIYTLQSNINTLLDNLETLDSQGPFSSVQLFHYTIVINLFWYIATLLILFNLFRHMETTVATSTTPNKEPLPVKNSNEDFSHIVHTMKHASKGEINLRMDERQQGQKIAAQYNEMMSSIYKRIVKIHQICKRAKLELPERSDLSISTHKDIPNESDQSQSNALAQWVEITFSMAGAVDQLERRLSHAGVSDKKTDLILNKIDESQSLLRAKIRDHQQNPKTEPRNTTAPAQSATPNTQLINMISEINKELEFFKLGRKL